MGGSLWAEFSRFLIPIQSRNAVEVFLCYFGKNITSIPFSRYNSRLNKEQI